VRGRGPKKSKSEVAAAAAEAEAKTGVRVGPASEVPLKEGRLGGPRVDTYPSWMKGKK